ncbi:MAG: hypothetical protein ACE5OY_05105 [Candidatus Bathyarchaeia archaeon]
MRLNYDMIEINYYIIIVGGGIKHLDQDFREFRGLIHGYWTFLISNTFVS